MNVGQNNFELIFSSEYELALSVAFLTIRCPPGDVSSEPEVISQSKIFACATCCKVFSCEKKLSVHRKKLKHNMCETGVIF